MSPQPPGLWAGAPWSPRKWQAEVLPLIIESLKGGKAGVVSAVMGSGKSIALSEIVAAALPRAIARGTPIVVTAPSRKLVRQLSATLRARLGDDMVGCYFTDAKQAQHPVVVACNASAPDLAAALPGRCCLWIADECHGTQSETMLAAAAALKPACKVGFTATPYRSNANENLELWDELLYSYSLGDALGDEVLVPWRTINWDGEGDGQDVDAIVLDLIGKHCDGPGIVSARSIEDAEHYAEYLCANDIEARAIHSKQTRKVQDGLLEDLRTGTLEALVHVALLAEGVDLPWLRWLALRRRVGSPVRLFQEFGRVLRVHPGKAEAVVIDPYNLLGSIGLGHCAQLGDNDELAAKLGMDDEEEDDEFPLLELPPISEGMLPEAVAVTASGVWARALLNCLEANRLYERTEFDKVSAKWRKGDASAKQLETIGKMRRFAAALPPQHARALRDIIDARQVLDKGAATDLLSVVFAIAKCREKDVKIRKANFGYYPPGHRNWRWPDHPEVCELPKRVRKALTPPKEK